MAREKSSTTRVVLVGSLAHVICSMPLFLVGAMAVQMRAELRFSAVALGAVISLFRLTQAAAASVLGDVVDRIGATRSLLLAVVVIQGVCVGVATTTRSWLSLAAWMCVAAVAKAMVQPAANRLIVNNVPLRRQGTAVGFKQAASPIATMISGLMVPAIAVTVGWRWSYVLVSVLGFFVIAFVGRPQTNRATKLGRGRRKREPLEARGMVLMIAAAFGMGNAASSSVPAFWVDYAVVSGATPEFAGVMLAAASVGAIVSRIVSGAACDRLRTGHLYLCSALLALGSMGLLGLALTPVALHPLSVIFAQSGAWGFSAALWFTVLRAYHRTPGRITGVLAVGSLIGASLGPLVFGFLVDWATYSVAWGVAGAGALVASVGMALLAGKIPERAEA